MNEPWWKGFAQILGYGLLFLAIAFTLDAAGCVTFDSGLRYVSP